MIETTTDRRSGRRARGPRDHLRAALGRRLLEHIREVEGVALDFGGWQKLARWSGFGATRAEVRQALNDLVERGLASIDEPGGSGVLWVEPTASGDWPDGRTA